MEDELVQRQGHYDRKDQQSQESVNSHPKDLKSTTGDFGTLDTSELSTDESHLTKTSTAKSSNDFSSTDKIDISDLPLPALPPKKRRSKSRSYRDANFTHSQSTKGQPQQQQIQHSSRHSSFENLLDPKAQFIAKRRESLEISARNFNEKLEARKMHFHNMGHMRHSSATANSSKPTYLFGEKCYTTTNPNHLTTNPKKSNIIGSVVSDEIYLNKSGWVQVNSKRLEEENYYSHQNGIGSSNTIPHFKNTVRVIQIDNATRDKQPVYSVPKIAGSKIEELISRSEARRNNTQLQRTGYLKSGCKIVDSQLATILNERPGFLPVKTFMETESPPPVTPILSPPPAFQDTKSKYRNEKQNQIKAQINSSLSKQIYHPSQITVHHQPLRTNGNSTSGSKGMVFSRSFEYETRKPTSDYAEVFSKSFDSNLSDTKPSGIIGAIHRDRSPNFSTLTGNSPNYLTKKESSQSNISNQQSRDNSPKYQQIGYINPIAQSKTLVVSHTKELPPYNSSNIIPRKIEKPKTYSFDRNGRSRRAQFTRYNQTATMPVSRFRSFDQNINARLNSCDSGARSDLSNDELDNEEDNSSEFLTAAYQSQSNFRQQKQRSLTPDKYDSQGSQCSLRKQRSLTPENRSLTPEERRKKGSQASLSSRQNSSSRSNTLERKGKYDDKSLSASRSSSTSSSYSGGDHNELLPTHRRSTIRNAKAPEEYRIRRSRSLQLTERSPNRQIQRNGNHQSINIIRPSQQIRNANFPPTIRPSQIISDPMNTNATIISINSRTNSATIRNPNDNIDKSRSFDFDYNVGSVGNSGGVIVSSSVNSINQHITGGRLDFDKSRSFDEDYREQSNNLVKSYLTSETISGGGSTGVLGNLLKSGNRSAGGSGSSSSCGGGGLGGTGGGGGSGGSGSQQQLHQQTSPQNYGTRLCDHEMTYDMLRRTLDRSPIMDFSGRVSGSNIVGGPDYDIPQSMINRETINAGGNSELNFTSDRIYDHGMNLTKTSKRLNHSPSDSLYSIDRLHASRDSITPDSTEDRLRSEYGSIIYRQQSQRLSGQDRSNSAGGNLISGSSGLSGNTTALTSRGSYNISNNINNTNNTTTNTNNIKTLCEFYPNCGSINNSGSLKLRSKIPNIKHTRSKSNKYLHRNLSQRKNNLYNDNINNNNNNNNSNINNNNINYNRNNRRIHVSSSVNDLLQINSDDEQLYMNINKKMNARLKKSSVSSIPIIQQYQQQQHNSSNNEHYNSIGDFNNKQKQIYHDLKNRINTNISLHITEDIINNQKQQKSPIVLNKNINNGNNKIKPSPKLNKKNMPTTMIIDENQQTQQLKQQNKKLSPKNNLIGSIKIKPSINYNIGGINNNTNNIINNNNNNNYNNNNHIIQPKCNSTGNSPKYFKTDYKLSPTTLASTIIFFGDREMPVTRDSTPISSITSSPTAIPTQQQQHFYNTSGINNSNYNNKINNSGSSGVGCSSGISGCNTSSGFNIGGGITTTGIGNNRNNPIEYESGAKSLEYSGYCGKSMRFSGERPKTKLLDSNIHQFGKKRSISLPNIFLETK
ncbi:putative uncharacterized protein DDB_G0277255 [Condylostylus longicornis]|uniref:putative uncharacterized protein DDB_G0277255 n=1 Tax=Condylostylus longicornis TaxID=2530218 RepID=UPI00244E39BC|nr:putative uncharacterized protein DDB_G0277255 [Condylostylus longicornis]